MNAAADDNSGSESFTDYSAHAFHDSLKNGRSSGTLRVSASGFRFVVDGEVKVHLPLRRTRLTLGGASDRMIFFSHPDVPEWSIYTSDRSLLKHAGLNSIPELAGQIRQMKSKRLRNWSIFAAVVVLVCLLPLYVIFNMDGVARVLANQVPKEWETQLGQSAYAQFQVQHQMLDDKQADKLLAKLTDVLTDQLPDHSYDFHFHIVNDPTLNAFALPGGYIVINSGLIMRADNANELLGVLAHEMTHVTRQHGLRSIITSAGIIVVVQALFGDASGLLATVASATPVLLNLQYSRAFESEADAGAVVLLGKADINPNGLVTFFDKLVAEQEAMKAKIKDKDTAEVLDTVSGFLSTHPATQDRIADIKKLATFDKPPYRNMEAPFTQLQDIVKRFVTKQQPDSAGDQPVKDQ